MRYVPVCTFTCFWFAALGCDALYVAYRDDCVTLPSACVWMVPGTEEQEA